MRWKIANEVRSAEMAIIILCPISANGIIVLLKKIPGILLDLAVFALQEQPGNNLWSLTQVWYND